MAEAFVSSREMVEEIWRRVAARRDLRAISQIQALPNLPQLNHDPERHLINAQWNLDRRITHVPPAKPFARTKGVLKRRAAAFTVAVLERYFDDERTFFASLVRFQNNVAEAHDQLAKEMAALHCGTLSEFERLMSKLESLEETVELLQSSIGQLPNSARQAALNS
jgi:hypothetical protein